METQSQNYQIKEDVLHILYKIDYTNYISNCTTHSTKNNRIKWITQKYI